MLTWNLVSCYKTFLFYFMMEPHAEIKKLGWATDGGSSDIKFFFFKFHFNMEPQLKRSWVWLLTGRSCIMTLDLRESNLK